MSAGLRFGNVKTVQGSDVMISSMGGAMLSDAKSVAACNGAIHAIDSVLIPN